MQSPVRRILLVAVTLVLSAGMILAQAEKVYVTKTGSKYHRASCSSLSKSKIEMPLEKAAARYGVCKNCKPPVPEPAAAPRKAVPPPVPTVMHVTPKAEDRCEALTKKGIQCSRRAQPNRNFCWQH